MTATRFRWIMLIIAALGIFVMSADTADAQKKKKAVEQKPSGDENDYYRMHTYTLPEGEVLEGGGLEMVDGIGAKTAERIKRHL